MRWLIPLAVAAAALYLVFNGDDDRDPASTSERQGEPVTRTMPSVNGKGDAPRHDVVVPALPAGRATVVIDDGPRQPGEEYGRSKRRGEVARMFETFRKQAELTRSQVVESLPAQRRQIRDSGSDRAAG